MSATYRIVNLCGTEIYRIEKWTKHRFSHQGYWKVQRFSRYVDFDSINKISEFDSLEPALVWLQRLQNADREAQARKRGIWQTVRVV